MDGRQPNKVVEIKLRKSGSERDTITLKMDDNEANEEPEQPKLKVLFTFFTSIAKNEVALQLN